MVTGSVEVSSIEQRLAALERSNRRLRRALGVAALVALGPILLAQTSPTPDVLEARRVKIVDAEGAVVLDLGADASGKAALRVRNRGGQVRASVDGEGVTLYDDSGVVTANLRADDGLLIAPKGVRRVRLGPDGLVLGDAQGAGRLALEIDKGLLVADAKGVARVAVTPQRLALNDETGINRVAIDPEGGFALADARGINRVTLKADTLALSDENERTRISIEALSGFTLRDAEGRPRAVVGSITTRDRKKGEERDLPLSTLMLIDPWGKIRFQAP